MKGTVVEHTHAFNKAPWLIRIASSLFIPVGDGSESMAQRVNGISPVYCVPILIASQKARGLPMPPGMRQLMPTAVTSRGHKF